MERSGLLGVALLAYLFAVHLAESRAGLAVLRPQVPLLAVGLGWVGRIGAFPSFGETNSIESGWATKVLGGVVVC